MIFEPQTERNYSLWVDGYLPHKNKLEEITSQNGNRDKLFDMNDTVLTQSFDYKLGVNFHDLQYDRKKKPRSYVHLLKPKSLIGSTGIYNPIANEDHDMQNRNNYRLFGLFVEELIDDQDKDIKSLRRSFLKTINDYQFDIKNEESYTNKEIVKSHLSELSYFILDGHFFPHSSIRRGLQNIGFESDEFTFSL